MKYRTLLVLMVLIIVWSLFFAIFKYYVWGILKTEVITLQFISGYLSFGTLFAYILGGFLYEILREKTLQKFASVGAIILFSGLIFVSVGDANLSLSLGIISLGVGVFYGLWVVLKNILIASAIQETGLSDTKVNGLANIFFITSIIVGSIAGGIIAEKLSTQGIYVAGSLLVIALGVGKWIRPTNGEKGSILHKMNVYKTTYLSDFLFIIRKYFVVMFFASILLTIATILSQKAIEYSVDHLGKTGSESAILLLYSAVGAIVGNLVSMKITHRRWEFFVVFGVGFAITSFLFPSLVDDFAYTSVLVAVAGFFFGVSYNLIESYFFKKIADDNKKAYGSASLGVVTSLTLAGLMFLVDTIQKQTSFAGVYYFMGLVILVMSAWIGLRQKTYSK